MRVNLLLLKWALRQWREETLPLEIAHRLPRRLRYWVTIDSIAKATTGKYGTTDPTTLPAMTVLDRI